MYLNQVGYSDRNKATKLLLIAQIIAGIVTVSKFAGGYRGLFVINHNTGVIQLVWAAFTYNFTFVPDSTSLVYAILALLIFYHFSSLLESQIGTRRFVKYIVPAAAGGGLLHYAFINITGGQAADPWSPACANVLPLCNAIIVAGTMRFSYLKIRVFKFDLPLWSLGLTLIIITLVHSTSGFSIVPIIGSTLIILGRLYVKKAINAMKEKEVERIQGAELDQILEKIQRSGIDSLSSGEKRLLEKASEYMRRRQ